MDPHWIQECAGKDLCAMMESRGRLHPGCSRKSEELLNTESRYICLTGTWATFLKNGSHPICRGLTDENTVQKQEEHIHKAHEPIYKLLKVIPLVAWIKTRSNDAEKKYGLLWDVGNGTGRAINTSKDKKKKGKYWPQITNGKYVELPLEGFKTAIWHLWETTAERGVKKGLNPPNVEDLRNFLQTNTHVTVVLKNWSRDSATMEELLAILNREGEQFKDKQWVTQK